MSSERPQPRWIAFAFALNVALAVAHVVVFGLTKSRLVLAQGADSLMDVAAVAVLAVSAQVARRPRDEDHPFGHGRAEPIGALLVAAFAGVLAFEVGRSAIAALLGHDDASIDASVAGVLALKLGVKTLFVVVLARRARASRSPALSAVVVDARNDLAVTGSSLVGYAAARYGFARADAILALPICMYIAYNGLSLARENIRYLMGASPGAEVVEVIRASAASVEGVLSVPGVEAHFVGSEIHVEVTVVVSASATATEGHDVAVAVQRAVEANDMVARAFVHVDTDAAER
ncbi:MAG: cation transporter [Myxococcales bacterium]|nr:cation transporter [Myxococcales bacterium]